MNRVGASPIRFRRNGPGSASGPMHVIASMSEVCDGIVLPVRHQRADLRASLLERGVQGRKEADDYRLRVFAENFQSALFRFIACGKTTFSSNADNKAVTRSRHIPAASRTSRRSLRLPAKGTPA